MKALLFLIIVGTLLSTSDVSNSVALRSCPGRMLSEPCSEFWRFDTVFIGSVKQLVNEPFPEGTALDWQQYRKVTATVTVEEVFRGKLASEVVFEMDACFFQFVKGEKYLIYTGKDKDGKLTLHRDQTRTRLLSQAREDLGLHSLPARGTIWRKDLRYGIRPSWIGDASRE
jgi:hypothetical protein